ncbi:MAG: maleate cis-trans isomerase [Candidatus Thermoplasmatota archaeon]|nr:maleate cis-trans isomerase [Candidatus Thermoplasmatota archaeon]
MYGWRKRVGLIVPSSNTTMECEMWSALPQGISLHTARIPLKEVNAGALEDMDRSSMNAATSLIDAEVDCILFGCTSGSLIKGKDYNTRRSEEMEKELKVPFITTSTAVVEALKSFSARELSVVTPYIDEVNEREKEFLESCGFPVRSIRGMGIEKNREIGRVMPQELYRFASDSGEGDCLFISCTNLRTFEIIEVLERDMGIPVVTSNQASLWFSLNRMGIKGRLEGLGSLWRA